MQLSSRQRAMVGVLGVCGLALVADRLFVLPSSAGAAEAVHSSESLVIPPDDAITTLDLVLPTSEATLADHLRDLADDRLLDATRVPDAFLPPMEWLPADDGARQANYEGSEAARFAVQHTLTAVMVAGAKSHAVVDGEVLLIGHSVDGFDLTDVGARSAEFRSDHETVTLRLADPGR